MLLDIAIIVFLMVAAILLILAEIFLLPGITLAGQAKIIPNVMIDKDKVRCPTHIPTV